MQHRPKANLASRLADYSVPQDLNSIEGFLCDRLNSCRVPLRAFDCMKMLTSPMQQRPKAELATWFADYPDDPAPWTDVLERLRGN